MDSKQNFLEAALAVGLECQLIEPADVLRHLPPEVLASNLPADSKTKLLSASLRAGKMDPDLVFEALDVRVFAENMPKHLLWACIAEAAKKALDQEAPKASTSPAKSPEAKPRRRPNLSRRPARLAQTRPKRKTGEVDIDSEASGRWASATTNSGVTPREPSPEPSPSPPPPPPTAEQPFNEWVEETVTGDPATRRKR